MAGTHPIDRALRRRILDHVVSAVEATPLLPDPFPHLVTGGFFPTDVYQRLLESFPPEASFEAFQYEKFSNNDGASNRKRFRFENACLDGLPGSMQEFWYAVRAALGSVELKQAVWDKLSDGLAFRYGCKPADVSKLPGFALPELFRETAGYRIKPHPDTRKKVVTMQIALPGNASQKALGTEFYRRSLRPSAWFREPKGFDIVKTMPFLPNTAYAFVVLNTMRLKSWHGKSTLAASSGTRYSILNIWYEKVEHANAEIVAEQQALAPKTRAA